MDVKSKWPKRGLVGLVLVGVAVGLSHHGQLRFGLTEVRPFFYLMATFLFASMLVTSRVAIRAVLWVLVVGIG